MPSTECLFFLPTAARSSKGRLLACRGKWFSTWELLYAYPPTYSKPFYFIAARCPAVFTPAGTGNVLCNLPSKANDLFFLINFSKLCRGTLLRISLLAACVSLFSRFHHLSTAHYIRSHTLPRTARNTHSNQTFITRMLRLPLCTRL